MTRKIALGVLVAIVGPCLIFPVLFMGRMIISRSSWCYYDCEKFDKRLWRVNTSKFDDMSNCYDFGEAFMVRRGMADDLGRLLLKHRYTRPEVVSLLGAGEFYDGRSASGRRQCPSEDCIGYSIGFGARDGLDCASFDVRFGADGRVVSAQALEH